MNEKHSVLPDFAKKLGDLPLPSGAPAKLLVTKHYVVTPGVGEWFAFDYSILGGPNDTIFVISLDQVASLPAPEAYWDKGQLVIGPYRFKVLGYAATDNYICEIMGGGL